MVQCCRMRQLRILRLTGVAATAIIFFGSETPMGPAAASPIELNDSAGAMPYPMDVVFVHGFGGPNDDEKRFVQLLHGELEKVGARVHAPTYHPGRDLGPISLHNMNMASWEGGRVGATSLTRFLEELRALAEATPGKQLTALLGFSVGGFVVANFQERWPHLVKRAVLLAPAIDNFERNFEGKAEQEWYMPTSYVPTMLVHGECETDDGGSALWRVQQWAETEIFTQCFFPIGLGHSMDIVEAGPGFRGVLSWVLAETKDSTDAR
eukprot:symbB.v1.2.030165.t1/scaffold3356.1/size58521/6